MLVGPARKSVEFVLAITLACFSRAFSEDHLFREILEERSRASGVRLALAIPMRFFRLRGFPLRDSLIFLRDSAVCFLPSSF